MNMFFQKRYIQTELVSVFIIFTLLTGCTGSLKSVRVVRPDDLVQVHYTCRLKNGDIVETTDEKTAMDTNLKKSGLFKLRRQGYGPVLMRAGGDVAGVVKDDRQKSFKDHIAVHLAGLVPGAPLGQATSVMLQDALMDGLKKEDRFLRLSRTWQYPKEEIVARKEYEERLGKEPELGLTMPWRAPFTATVYEITDDFVKFKIQVPSDAVMETPFGAGNITDTGERWSVEVDAVKDRLVRSGPLLGRIAEVGKEMFTVDFGYPLGNEPLVCEFTPRPVSSDQKEQLGHALKAGKETKNGKNEANVGESIRSLSKPIGSGTVFLPESMQEAPDPAVSMEGASDTLLKAAPGDLVMLHYKAMLEDGSLVQTSMRGIAEDQSIQKAIGYRMPSEFGPVEIIAGDQDVFPGLGDAVLGMVVGEKKKVPLVPERAFGIKAPERIEKYDAVKRIPTVGIIAAEEYVRRFKTLPLRGKEVPFTPYFNSRVVDMNEKQVTLEALAKDGTEVQNEFGGLTKISIEENEVVLRLVPEIGAAFSINDKKGMIIAHDENTFTVDFNHPLAGQPVVIEVELVSMTKASNLENMQITWLEDHDAGLETARAMNKPVVLVLYADWCGYSKKLFNESLKSPLVVNLQDDFIWVKIDSEKHSEYKEYYKQNGFPLIVFLDSEGNILKRIDGYRPARELRQELRQFKYHKASGGPVEYTVRSFPAEEKG